MLRNRIDLFGAGHACNVLDPAFLQGQVPLQTEF